MNLDVNTLFMVTIYVEAILGLLLLFAWAQNTQIRAVAWWGFAQNGASGRLRRRHKLNQRRVADGFNKAVADRHARFRVFMGKIDPSGGLIGLQVRFDRRLRAITRNFEWLWKRPRNHIGALAGGNRPHSPLLCRLHLFVKMGIYSQ